MMSTSHIQTLRTMLRDEKGIILPGAPNALAARIIADLGFRAVYHEPSAALRYAIPVVGVAGATLDITSSLVSFGQTPPFYLAIVLSGFFGGRRPALLALVLSISPAVMFFVYPPHLLVGFTLFGLVIGWLSGVQYETADSLKKTGKDLRQMVEELERSSTALRAEIAAREQAEAELLRSHSELAHANRVATMGQLTASIAHEIKQPIASSRNNARAALNFLDKSPPDVATREQFIAAREITRIGVLSGETWSRSQCASYSV